MSGRRRYLVAYDIANQARLQRIRLVLEAFGDRIQYSVFLCDLSIAERHDLERRCGAIMNAGEDSIMQIDLGPVASAVTVRTFGRRKSLPSSNKPLIV